MDLVKSSHGSAQICTRALKNCSYWHFLSTSFLLHCVSTCSCSSGGSSMRSIHPTTSTELSFICVYASYWPEFILDETTHNCCLFSQGDFARMAERFSLYMLLQLEPEMMLKEQSSCLPHGQGETKYIFYFLCMTVWIACSLSLSTKSVDTYFPFRMMWIM